MPSKTKMSGFCLLSELLSQRTCFACWSGEPHGPHEMQLSLFRCPIALFSCVLMMHLHNEETTILDGDKKPKTRENEVMREAEANSNRTLQDANAKAALSGIASEKKYRSVAHIQDHDAIPRERKHRSRHDRSHKSTASLPGEARKHKSKRDLAATQRRSSSRTARRTSSESRPLHTEGNLDQRNSSESTDLLAKARLMRMEASCGKLKLPPYGRQRSMSLDDRTRISNQSIGHDRRRTHEGHDERRRSSTGHGDRKRSSKSHDDRGRHGDRENIQRKSSSSASHSGERDHDREMRKLKAKARSIRKRTTQNQLLQEAVDHNNRKLKRGIDRTRHSQDSSQATREPSLARSTSESSLKLDDIFRSENETCYSNSTNDVSESQESVLDRMSASLSSLSSYFDSFKISAHKEDGSRTNADTRHLLYLGQQSSELHKAQMLLEDKGEWRKLQLQMKQKGVITNQGARQVLNPLLEKSEQDRNEAEKEKRKPPPIIFIDDDMSLGNSEHSSIK